MCLIHEPDVCIESTINLRHKKPSRESMIGVLAFRYEHMKEPLYLVDEDKMGMM